jgi:hypothetical protein
VRPISSSMRRVCCGLFVAPGVAGDHGDAEDLDLGGLQEDHHRHLVGAAGAGAVLIDEDEALAVFGGELNFLLAEGFEVEGVEADQVVFADVEAEDLDGDVLEGAEEFAAALGEQRCVGRRARR